MRLILLCLCIFMGTLYAETSLKERLLNAQPGDYIVTTQGSTTSVLMVRAIDPPRLILEEITVPHKTRPSSWKEWVAQKAPGHTGWVAYVFDCENNGLTQCYSHQQKQFLFVNKADYFLASLITMPLNPTKESERKRVGAAPEAGEIDRRKIWLPSLIREGKKVDAPRFDIMRAKWPSDKTLLAGCTIELYLDSELAFPFPYWLEVQSPHYTFKIHAVDSGRGMVSPMPYVGSTASK